MLERGLLIEDPGPLFKTGVLAVGLSPRRLIDIVESRPANMESRSEKKELVIESLLLGAAAVLDVTVDSVRSVCGEKCVCVRAGGRCQYMYIHIYM